MIKADSVVRSELGPLAITAIAADGVILSTWGKDCLSSLGVADVD